MSQLQHLTLRQLEPFPLPKNLAVLPALFLEEFSLLYELVKGYVKSLTTYTQFEAELTSALDKSIEMLNKIIATLAEYQQVGPAMADQVKKIEKLYEEFTNLETYQYQLLSSNYNQNLLRSKYSKLAAASDDEATQIIKNYRGNSEEDLQTFLLRFKDSRKAYHLRREKLSRWEEERVSGFI